MVDEASRLRLATKAGKRFLAGPLYHLLQNPIYIGQIRHKDTIYPGLHQAIIDRDLWEGAQGKLADNRIERRNRTNAKHPSLLAGLMFDGHGRRFTPSHAVKDGKRYRYYIQRLHHEERQPGRRLRLKRIPAAEIEGLVVDAIVRLLATPCDLSEALGVHGLSADQARIIIHAGTDLAARIRNDAMERHAQIRQLVGRVVLADEAIHIDIPLAPLRQALALESMGAEQRDDTYLINVPARVRVRGVELRFVIEGPDRERPPEPDPSLIRVAVQGHDWFDRLLTGQARTLQDIATDEGVTDRYVRRLIDLAFVAPDNTAAILDGRQPIDLTAERITDLLPLPENWTEQRRVLGFS